MKKKPASSTQVRIDIELSDEIDILRAGFSVRTSRAAFVESLLRKGIEREKIDQGLVIASKLVGDATKPAESAFKK